MSHDIDTILDTTSPTQSTVERNELFLRIMREVDSPVTPAVVRSPYVSWVAPRAMVVAVVCVLLITTAGGTVAAAESARPGDWLFPIDQAAETVRLTLASEERRETLKADFLVERMTETESIIAEVATRDAAGEGVVSTIPTSASPRVEAAIALINDSRSAFKHIDEERLAAFKELVARVQIEGAVERLRFDEDRIEFRFEGERVRIDQDDIRIDYRGNEDDSDKDDDRLVPVSRRLMPIDNELNEISEYRDLRDDDDELRRDEDRREDEKESEDDDESDDKDDNEGSDRQDDEDNSDNENDSDEDDTDDDDDRSGRDRDDDRDDD